MVSAWRMVDRKQLRYHLRTTRFDAGIVLLTAAGRRCHFRGVLHSDRHLPVLRAVRPAGRPVAPERADGSRPSASSAERTGSDPPCGRIVIFDLEGELFFGSSPELEHHFARIEERVHEGVRVVVIRLRRVRNPDAVCLDVMDSFVQRMAQRKLTLLLCGVRHDMAKAMRNSGLVGRIGAANIFREREATGSSTLEAVRFAYELLGEDHCSTCPRRQDGSNGKEPLYYMI